MHLSIIIPVRNEEKFLPRCLEHLAYSANNIATLNYEVIVVLNRSSDSSEEIARKAGCILVKEDSKNLSIIRNSGVKHARGEFIITIDADSFMSSQMIPDIIGKLKNPKIVGGGVLMFPERWSLGIFLTGALLIFPLSLWHGLISAGLFYCRREDFWAIGGFNENMYSAEDVDFAKRLKAYGKTRGQKFSTIFTSYLVTSCRKFDRFGDWYFIKNPIKTLNLLKGQDRETANLYWYDFGDRK